MELKHKGKGSRRPSAVSLNRTFYGIETLHVGRDVNKRAVLIVPFMELKLVFVLGCLIRSACLNRTFYGIETAFPWMSCFDYDYVLIVPFMELKHRSTPEALRAARS